MRGPSFFFWTVEEVILPERNKKDLHEVPQEVKDQLQFHFVRRVDEVLDLTLERPPERFSPKLSPPKAETEVPPS